MPLTHGLDVAITTTALKSLTEYGSHSLGRTTKQVSTRIEAKSGLQFYIRVRPESPFPLSDADVKASLSRDKHSSRKKVKPEYQSKDRDDYLLRRPRCFDDHQPVEQVNHDSDHDHLKNISHGEEKARIMAEDNKLKYSPEPGVALSHYNTRSSTSTLLSVKDDDSDASITKFPSPPFDLTASVYIDGRSKPECRQVIYLDPSHPKYDPAGFVFKGRWVAPPGDSGNKTRRGIPDAVPHIGIRDWVFTDVGIDVLMSRMGMIEPNGTLEIDPTMSDLTSSLKSSVNVSTAERPKPGQIEVRVRRILAGEPRSDQALKPYHYAGDEEVADANSIGDDCTHTTKLRASTSGKSIKLNTIPWAYYKSGEDLYARFTFNYMSRAKLVKLGQCTEDGLKIIRPSLGKCMVEHAVGKRSHGGEELDGGEDEKAEQVQSTRAQSVKDKGRTSAGRKRPFQEENIEHEDAIE